MPDYFYTIEKPSLAEYKDRGSKFLAYAFPIASTDDFRKRMKELRDEHPKAAHHCFAYRLGTDGNQYRAGDDGEPAGTAGKPILGQIDSKQLTNIAVVVVRYFGGTLLGVPGLIAAYKTVTSLVLQLSPIVEKPILSLFEMEFDYTLMNDVMQLVKKYKCEVLQQEMQLFCKILIGVPKSEETGFLNQVANMHTVQVKRNH